MQVICARILGWLGRRGVIDHESERVAQRSWPAPKR
jgi:hypothetical protein